MANIKISVKNMIVSSYYYVSTKKGGLIAKEQFLRGNRFEGI